MMHRFFSVLFCVGLFAMVCSCGGTKEKSDGILSDVKTGDVAITGDGLAHGDGLGELDTAQADIKPQPKAFGEPCDTGEQCESANCLKEGLPEWVSPYCTAGCDAGTACPDTKNYACDEEKKICIPTYGPKGPGVFCQQDAECGKDLFCYTRGADDPEAYCSKPCESSVDCPTTFDCADGGDKKVCLKRDYCRPCTKDVDCAWIKGKCIKDDNGDGFCSLACTMIGDSCAKGSKCKQFSDDEFYCYPLFGACVGTGEICHPCRTEADCQTDSTCYFSSFTKERFCTPSCGSISNTCPNPFACFTIPEPDPFEGSWCFLVSLSGYVQTTCYPLTGAPCDPCYEDADCATTNRCFPDEDTGESYCAELCSNEEPVCPPRTTCKMEYTYTGKYLLCIPDEVCSLWKSCDEVICSSGKHCYHGQCVPD